MTSLRAGCARLRWIATPLTIALSAACAPDLDAGLGVVGEIDTSAAGLAELVRTGVHRTWTDAPRIQPNAGPHARARIYANPTLEPLIPTTTATFAPGSAAVAELLGEDGATIERFVAAVKVTEGSDQQSWIWWLGEGEEAETADYGRGLLRCAHCHVSGRDYMMGARIGPRGPAQAL